MADGNRSNLRNNKFYSLNAEYLVAEHSSPLEITNDATCFLAAAKSIVESVANELRDDGSQLAEDTQAASNMLWGALHLLEMAYNANSVAMSRSAA